MNIKIRQELEKDYNGAEEVVKQAFLNEAFSDRKEHELVNRIRKCDAFIPELSLVAVDKEVVGHVLLSKVKIVDGDTSVESLALAPVSVAPDYQKKGIGSLLISNVLRKAKELGYHSVIVLGHKDYYPKFGFKPASIWNICAPFEVPDEVFMAMELTENALQNLQGIVQYSEAFSE
ncbi:GNAT family N-acetyltransferase [Bacillus pseudomycoides]|uniref:GNAT family N-acetyltransferase n=1 Tax=Bacillus pseudomycoides TaxID=64104 RepID=UPI000BED08EA|nr:N-acetyltransferase [Bacillus pseudomycoides]PED06194.1 GNAT family N-acetyltransferase [Bacillus pseudomycoides]PEI94722.1 GNAT family N-acetyltransferase [Bacillus pseudomycoides]PEK19820.1 GNAT family N-acetyltransferase [Bacillus pseudomycoides]PEM71463.1 GNAT family N-acetyltransferase [Bacillus pseudomycoides]PEO06320.1 GNAT family N-acetyltransferase [Bacillus pseudomycoides]